MILLVAAVKYMLPLATGFDISQANTFDPILRPLQGFSLGDFFFSRITSCKDIEKDTNIILVNIGEPDRMNIANQLNIISGYRPKVVAVDVIFRNMKDSVSDRVLAETMSRIPNLVLASEIHAEDFEGEKKYIHSESEDAFSRNGISAHVGLIKRLDNKAAGFVPVDLSLATPVYSLPVKIAQIYDSAKAARLIARGNPSELINFKRNLDKYTVFDIDGLKNYSNPEIFRGKIVILGYLGSNLRTNSSGDRIHTPLNPFYMGNSVPDMYGAVVIANIVSMILEENYVNTNLVYPEYFHIIFNVLSLSLFIIALFYFTLRFSAKQAFARFLAFSIVFVLALAIGLALMLCFDYMLYMHGFINGLVFSFAVFEAYAFVFRKRLAPNE